MTGLEPAVRASYLRLLLDRADELVPGSMRGHLADAELTAIECAGPLVWLPITIDLALQRALAELLGPERASELLRASLRQVWASTPIRAIIQTAVGLLGVNPGSLARLVPNAWNLLYRECGRWSVERPETELAEAARGREILLRLAELPQACADEPAWLEAVATILHALLILCDAEGEVELIAREARTGTSPRSSALFRLQWRA
ncbi:hypothetical protein ACNOYE_15795 [Nannocystaceae bacterium ST9]